MAKPNFSSVHPSQNKISSNYQKETENIIDYPKASGKQSISRKLRNFIKRHEFIYNSIESSLTIICFAEYILYTYTPKFTTNFFWIIPHLFIKLYQFIFLLMKILASQNKPLRFYVDFVFESLPIFAFLFGTGYYGGFYELDQKWHFLINFFSVFRLWQLPKLSSNIENQVTRKLAEITIIFIMLIMIFAASLQYIERIQQEMPQNPDTDRFHFYYYLFVIMSTLSTLGYENPFNNTFSKLLIILIIFCSIAVIPAITTEVISLFNESSIYRRNNYKRVEKIKFIVITGNFTTLSLIIFLREYFHEDHGNEERHAVILSSVKPDHQLETLFREPRFAKKIIYLQGDPLDENDLKRVQIEKAQTVMIMCKNYLVNAEEEDSKTILKAIFIKKYLDIHHSETRLCIQMLRSEGKAHYILSLNKQVKNDQVACVQELKMSLFAKACICPGLIAFITNLINSSGDPDVHKIEKDWLLKYWIGMGFEIYKTKISSYFNGRSFARSAKIIYRKFKAVLFAIELTTNGRKKLIINPGKYELPRKGEIIGYLIAEDTDVAAAVRDYKQKGRHSFLKKSESLRTSFSRGMAIFEGKEDYNMNERYMGNKVNNFMNSDIRFLEKKCYISPSKIEFPDICYQSLEGNILAMGHIVISGVSQNLIHFIMPLRFRFMKKYPPIVILNPTPPDQKSWNQISMFPEIYYVKVSFG